MADKRIVVPEEMFVAAHKAHCERYGGAASDGGVTSAILVAALRWLSENPVVPSAAQAHDIIGPIRVMNETSLIMAIEAWQRRMFLGTPEQRQRREIEEIIASHKLMVGELTTTRVLMDEAYRAGQNSVSK